MPKLLKVLKLLKVPKLLLKQNFIEPFTNNTNTSNTNTFNCSTYQYNLCIGDNFDDWEFIDRFINAYCLEKDFRELIRMYIIVKGIVEDESEILSGYYWQHSHKNVDDDHERNEQSSNKTSCK
ncbi:unnamed protein product [Rhizophagus irregularis]|nr:unnamed protein product [Rhizophagus irregularis]